jgi:hypothetical protein
MARDPQDEDSFLSRWARRKASVREVERQPEAAPPAPGEAGAVGPDDPDRPLSEEERAALPDPDTLGPGADFKAFLRKGVPEELRRRALRRLWRSNPVFSVIDGLAEYDLDYTDAATVVANLETAFQVGKGIVLPEEEEAERAAQRLGETTRAATPAAQTPAAQTPAAQMASAQTREAPADAGEPDRSEEDARERQQEPATQNPERTAAVSPPATDPAAGEEAPPAVENTPRMQGAAAPQDPPARPKGRAALRRWGAFASAEGEAPSAGGTGGEGNRRG